MTMNPTDSPTPDSDDPANPSAKDANPIIPSQPPSEEEVAADPMGELVAYLDGEVDAKTRQEVEATLQRDATARDEASKLKRTWDLLDYLPKTEASPDFTQRTISKLLPVPTAEKPPRGPDRPSTGSLPTPAMTPMPGPTAPLTPSAALATAPPATSSPAMPPQSGGTGWIRSVAMLLLVGVSSYFISSWVRTPSGNSDSGITAPNPDWLPLPDLRIIENLPRYWGVEDLEFAKALEQSELFAEDE
ncbi:anti-sigma factor family protein [Tuwongella immobilis]|uniref:Zinc-finger domain-containing protein n=1 Tax=Tuwongella immobilis TaxID=692036 RepID=A0A6C2YU38_9BACT|nr:hypothetical protein [Tuwongella immobilis]VIP05006.1 Uncharacterized protein OS=Planctomyces limnophilus (strain ATCC 43296 / DSM 3776 / IFAM 1008 / 290) GN=Plim_4211 PE=4 SV=1 [Tuwongella immobilis]VTS07370.1 Uncharacterized protein OS=Planctomyces limnophilus (strain ATCC 43296 / DSM 3776 / IFAM 1008 / 290) GN=Plim_4211 PE=4 SV=1 [Tuwongella immobilis]